jgi:hypothetical protein
MNIRILCLIMACELDETSTSLRVQYKYFPNVVVIKGPFVQLFKYSYQTDVLPKLMVKFHARFVYFHAFTEINYP